MYRPEAKYLIRIDYNIFLPFIPVSVRHMIDTPVVGLTICLVAVGALF